MKIDANILKNYIRKVSIGGEIMTINLNFTSDGLNTTVKEPSSIAMTEGKIKSTAFTDYEAIGELFIRDAVVLSNLIAPFTGDITIEKDGDTMIKLSNESREVHMILADESICDNVLRDFDIKLETTCNFTLSKSHLVNVVKDMKLLAINMVTIKHSGDELSFQIGKENEYDFTKHMIKVSGADATVSIGAIFMKTVEHINNNILLEIGTNMPVVIKDSVEGVSVTTIISPIVEL